MCDWCEDYLDQFNTTIESVRHLESDPPPKELTKALEGALEMGRSEWPTGLCRRLADVLVDVADGRARSPAHRGRWFNLLGFSLRPGFGDPLDRFRVDALWKLFTAPKPGSVGLESGIRYVTNPGLNNWDISLQKSFTVTERMHMQFRVDAFNAFNHTQFSALNSTLNFASLSNPVPTNLPYDASGNLVNRNGFGTVSTSRDARVLQTAVRFQF